MKMRKILAMVMALALTAALAVGGTLAYLTSQDTVTNTFTVGNVTITMDEADVKTDGTYETNVNNRTDANVYHLLPGHSYIKDPTIHVATGSEDCWLFVKVENGLAAIEDSSNTIASQLATNGWTPIAEGSNIYARATTNKAGDNVGVFENFKINGTVIGGAKPETPVEGALYLVDYATAQIVVTAYAIQADGFSTAAAAWGAANLA